MKRSVLSCSSILGAVIALAACSSSEPRTSASEKNVTDTATDTGGTDPALVCAPDIKGEDPTRLPKCTGPKGGDGRCVAAKKLGALGDVFVVGGCAAGTVCVAEDLVRRGTGVDLPTCKPVMGKTTEDGRCFTVLAKEVVANYDVLKGATGTQCAASTVCVPCLNPLAGNAPTGVCFAPAAECAAR